MKIIVAGGTGFIGRPLVNILRNEHVVKVLTRSPMADEDILWDGTSLGDWVDQLQDADAVINLSGESIANKRWTRKQKKILVNSRIQSSKILIKAMSQLSNKPKVFFNASAVGFYGNVSKEADEASSKGEGFLSDLCEQWEKVSSRSNELNIRTVLLRFGVVLGLGGGALKKMLLPFHFFLGGPLGDGNQWFPWIHQMDAIGIIQHVLKNENICGPVNVVAPETINMKLFCKKLGHVMKRPSWAPVPAFILKIILGQMAQELLLNGQKVIPRVVNNSSYSYQFPSCELALENILKKT